MKGIVRMVCSVIAAAALIVSCSKDDPSGSLAFDSTAKFVSAGDLVTAHFTASNVNPNSYSVTSKPTGWLDPEIDVATKTIQIIVPTEFSDEVVTSGSFVLSGTISGSSSAVTATIFVGIVDEQDLSSQPANSYLLNLPETRYLIDAKSKGETRGALATASVEVIWQTASGLIQYLDLVDGKVSFYIGADTDDDTKIKAGNALLGAYDADGNLIWSWHIWAADYDAEADALTYANGYTVMSRNLGATENANSSTDEKTASFGLYYQWGRKDPFIGPSTYLAASGSYASMYNGSGSRVYMKEVSSSEETGTMDYAIEHPMVFLSASEKEGDWLASAPATAAWSATKTVNDPCPSGWCVAPAAAFDGLSIKEDLTADYSAYEDSYGWTLTDGAVESLYMGAGRRSYLDASVQNTFSENLLVRSTAMEAQPWVGYYWTADRSADESAAFVFWFRKDNVGQSGLRNNFAMGRANGMPVRCVKKK